MIIIDQVADIKLAKTLETLDAQSETARCIYFNLKDNQEKTPGVPEKVVATVKERIVSPGLQVYLCEDGDIFILAPTLPTKDSKQVMLDVGEFLKRPVGAEWANFYEIPLHLSAIQTVLQQKSEVRRLAQENAQKHQEELQKTRKREAILNSIVASAADDITARRTARATAEFMIIEDDAFSRRLVENVLGKQYKLTGLGEATNALNTYARIAPDILFLDINLPDVTGHELLEKIIALDPNAYVIMLSGNADKENITQAMTHGAKGFIAKPFTREKLFQYIERCPTLQGKQRSTNS